MKSNSYSTFSISFYCRENKKNRQGLAPVELSVCINGCRKLYALPRKEDPEEFRKASESKRRNPIKDYLDEVRARVRECQVQAMRSGEILTSEMIRDFVINGCMHEKTVDELFEEYLMLLQKRVGINLTHKTFRKFELARDKFISFTGHDAPLSKIGKDKMKQFITVLEGEYEYQTTMGYASKIKSVLLYGLRNGMLQKDPFEGIQIRRWNREVQFLSEEELESIKCLKLSNKSLDRIRDLFIFQANSGMSFCDILALDKSDFQITPEGQYYVVKPRQKTGVDFISVILPDGVDVLKKYSFELPRMSNQKINEYLKVIQDLTGIEKPLHTHVARHTYATRCLNAGVRLEVVSKLLGHTNLRQTQHYAKLLKGCIINEVTEHFSSRRGGE